MADNDGTSQSNSGTTGFSIVRETAESSNRSERHDRENTDSRFGNASPRYTGPTTQTNTQGPNSTQTVENKQFPRLNPPRNERQSSSRQSQQKETPKPPTDNTQYILLITGLFDAMAVSTIAPEAKLTASEHFIIDPALKRMLDRATPEQIEKYSAFTDPLLLGMGLIFWGVRINGIVRKQKETVSREERVAASGGIDAPIPPSQTNYPTPNNGKAPEVAPANTLIINAIDRDV